MEEEVNDSVVRFIFENYAVRGVWVSLNKSVSEINSMHKSGLAAERMLGESLAAVVLLSRTIKLQGRVALQARGDGALKLLVAESTQDAAIRGVISLDDAVDENNIPSFKELIGSGYLAVTLLPDEGESYQGIVPLQGQRLQDCLAEYFALSEQLPTALWLASDGERAAGLMLQAMPSVDENDDKWQHLRVLANTVTPEELLSLPCTELLHRLFHQEEVRVFDPEAVRFQCTCSAERSRSALAVLGRDDLHKLFAEQPEVTIDCQFCGAKYHYRENDMKDILGDTSSQLH